jgi:hypothetical protein
MRIAAPPDLVALLGHSVGFDDLLLVISVTPEKLPKFVALLHHFLPNSVYS